eukprot:SM000041S15467  [mRNA]  locus=s41:266846:267563:- [translate_table: standard]
MAAVAAATGEVVARLVLTSLLMWLLPVALLLAVNSHLIPGARHALARSAGSLKRATLARCHLLGAQSLEKVWGLGVGIQGLNFASAVHPSSAASMASPLGRTAGLSSASTTLFGGLLAVLALNAVVCAYVLMALWDKPGGGQPMPDAAFAASARRSLLAHPPAPAAGVAAEDVKKRA